MSDFALAAAARRPDPTNAAADGSTFGSAAAAADRAYVTSARDALLEHPAQ